MAKQIKYTTIDEAIPSIDTPWSRKTGENTAEGYAGSRVEAFIKDELRRRGIVKYFDSAENTLYEFLSETDRDRWLETQDASVVICRTSFDFSGTLYKIDITNSAGTGTMYVTEAQDTAPVHIGAVTQTKGITDSSWSDYAEDHIVTVSVDRGGSGSYTPVISDRLVLDGDTLTADIRPYLANGNNRLRVTVTGSVSGQTSSAVYAVYLTSMYLAPSNFDWRTPFIEGQPFTLGGMNIGGALDKTLYVKVSNEGGYSATHEHHIGMSTYVTNAYAFTGMEFPSGGTGVYHVEIWVASGNLETDHLHYNIMCVAASDITDAQLVAVNNVADTAVNYTDCRLFDYVVYNGTQLTASVHFKAVATVNENPTLIADDILGGIQCGAENSFILPLEIGSEETSMMLRVEMDFGSGQQMVWNVDNSRGYPATSGASFYLNPASRSNASDERESIVNAANNSTVAAVWDGMSWVDGSDGWTTDETGRKCLRIPAGTSCGISYQPFAGYSSATGLTIEMVYRIANASDYDEPAISIADRPGESDWQGLVVKPKSLALHSSNLKDDKRQGYQTEENKTVHLMLTIVPNYKGWKDINVAVIYVNGCKAASFPFTRTDMWTLYRDIVIGSRTADTYLYKLRVYNKAVGATDVMRNCINVQGTTEEKRALSESIHAVVDDNYRVDIDAVRRSGGNYMVIEMLDGTELPKYGKGKSYKARANIRTRIRPGWVLVISNVELTGQGTTSMNYWVWNLRWRLDKCTGWEAWYEDEEGNRIADVPAAGKNAVWLDHYSSGRVAVQRVTAKKNYASSMQSHKMGATAAYNDLHRECCGENEVSGRVAVWQEPVYGFLQTPVEGTDQYNHEFMGLYTIGPDKGDKPTFGYDKPEVKATRIDMEGTDHSVAGVGYDYPYPEMEYDAEKESLCVRGTGAAAFEVGSNPELIEDEFRPAYEAVYKNSTMLLNVAQSIDGINADVQAFRKLKTADGHEYSRYEVYTDGVYDLYYFNEAEGIYKASGINVLADLGITQNDTEGKSAAEILEMVRSGRAARFREIAERYWDIDDLLFFMSFCLVFCATDNFKKNCYPYKLTLLSDGGRWRMRQDDLDTIFATDNVGLFTKSIDSELFDWTDAQKVAYVFKGEDSRLIRLMAAAFAPEMMAMLRNMLSAMARLGAGYDGSAGARDQFRAFFNRYFFDKAQNYFPVSSYNADAEHAYEEAYPHYVDGSYVVDVSPLAQSKGRSLELERQWTDERMIYIASYCHYGPFATSGNTDSSYGLVSFRTQSPQQLTLVPAIPMYPAVLEGQTASKHGGRTMAGEGCLMPSAGGTNTNIYICGADWLEDLGDLSQVVIDGDDLSITGKRLRRIKIGDEDAERIRNVMTGVTIGDCPCVTEIDARNLATLASDSIDLRGCPRLDKALFDGTAVKGVAVAEGSRVTVLHLPDTITSLQLAGLTRLTDLSVPSLANINYLWLSDLRAFDSFALLRRAYQERTNGDAPFAARVTGFDSEGTAEDITMLAEMVDDHHFTGIDITGTQSGEVPVVEGTLRIDGNVYEDDIETLRGVYGESLDIRAAGSYVRLTDAEFNRVMVGKYGDGKGITKAQVETVTDLANNLLKGNTVVETADLRHLVSLINLGTSNIGDTTGVFHTCTALRKVILPEGVRHLFGGCFKGCTSLTEINLPQSLLIIGNACFHSVPAPFVVDLPNLTTIGPSSFMNSGVVRVENLGKVKALTSGGSTWSDFLNCKSLESVKLPETLGSIGSYAFMNCTSLQTVDMPGTTEILSSVFSGCASLTDVHAPKLKSIGNFGFVSCASLTDVSFPELVTIGVGVFKDCKSLNTVSGLENVTEILYDSFRGCSSLTIVESLDSVQKIGDDVFVDCAMLTSVGSLRSVRSIGHRTFKNCKKLAMDVDTPDLIFIGASSFANTAITSFRSDSLADLPKRSGGADGSFYNCKSLTSVNLPNIINIGACNFYDCQALVSITMTSVATIGNNAFQNCVALESADMPNVKSIENSAFQDCSGLVTVNAPQIESIGQWCFRDCVSLESIDMTNVKTIGTGAFIGCRKLTDAGIGDLPNVREIKGNAFVDVPAHFIVDMPNLEILGSSAFLRSGVSRIENLGKITQMPDGGNDWGCFFGCKSLESLTLPETLITIGSFAFYGCSALKTVEIPGETEIKDRAFINCTSLTSVNIPNVTSIGAYAFHNCSSLVSIDLPKVTKIATQVFAQCISLKTVTGLGNLTTIGERAFQELSQLTALEGMENLERIGVCAFIRCIALKSVGDLSNVTTIDNNAFDRCSSLNIEMNFPRLTNLGSAAFKESGILAFSAESLTTFPHASSDNPMFGNCILLTNVHIPNVVTLGNYTFWKCLNLESVGMPAVEHIGERALAETAITTVDTPNATFVGEAAFQYCYGLTTVNIPKVETIKRIAFMNCSALESIDMTDVVSIGDQAFLGCEKLTDIGNIPNVETLGTKVFDSIPAQFIVDMPKLKTLSRSFANSKCTRVENLGVVTRLNPMSALVSDFSNCQILEYVKLPATLEYIGQYQFNDCPKLHTIVCMAEVPPEMQGSIMNGTMIEKCRIYVPDASVDAYRNAANWNTYAAIILPISELENGGVNGNS